MKQSRVTETQIIGILKQQESGSPTAEVCRKHGISSATFYKYKARFGGLEVSVAHRGGPPRKPASGVRGSGGGSLERSLQERPS